VVYWFSRLAAKQANYAKIIINSVKVIAAVAPAMASAAWLEP
jgi:hypothetical protein